MEPRPSLVSPGTLRRGLVALIVCLVTLAAAGVAPTGRAAPALATDVAGSITTNTTWTKANSPYNVAATVQVQAGVTLTIEPGVEVRFGQDAGLQVGGVLSAVGTAANPILFTGATKAPGSWLGLTIVSSSATPSVLQHVVVEYGGNPFSGFANLYSLDSNVTVRNSVFRNGPGAGIAAGLGRRVEIADTQLLNNSGAALRVQNGAGAQVDPVLSGLVAGGNGSNAIVYDDVRLKGAHTWELAGLPYILEGSFVVESGAQLTVAPGVEVRAEEIFLVEGAIVAEGTAAAPILFTGVSAQPGAWTGLAISSLAGSTPSSLRFVTVEYGGSDPSDGNLASAYGGGITVRGGVVSVQDSTVRHSLKHGVIGRSSSTLTMARTTLANNGGYALRFDSGSPKYTLSALTASGNQPDAIGHRESVQGAGNVWPAVGLPHVVEQSIEIAQGATLTIAPGAEVRMARNTNLAVNGTLSAKGTAAQPITITGVTKEPGAWGYISSGGTVELQHCDIGYGGGVNQTGMILVEVGAVLAQDCRLHHSASAAIQLTFDATALIARNQITANAFGVSNEMEDTVVDARNNWWGDPSGPKHETNPQGKGDSVSDQVLFDPWLQSPPDGVVGGGVRVQVLGPNSFVPGSTQTYAVAYFNESQQPIENALLMVALPSYGKYLDNSGGGIYWPQRDQLLWKLGALAPGSSGIVSFQVRYDWGLPFGLKDSTLAFLAGTNLRDAPFNVDEYLAYTPVTVTAEEPLAATDMAVERQASADFDTLYAQAVAQGFQFGVANRITYSNGSIVTEVVMLRFKDGELAASTLWRRGLSAMARTVDRSGYTVRNPRGAAHFDLQTAAWQAEGVVQVQGELQQARLTFGECMKNCIIELIPPKLIETVSKGYDAASKASDCVKSFNGDQLSIPKCAQIIKTIPGINEGIDLGICNSECSQDPSSHVCTGDKTACDTDGFPFGWMGVHSITAYKCDLATGRYSPGKTTTVCAQCEKCIEGVSGALCVSPGSGSGSMGAPTTAPKVSAAGVPAARSEPLALSSGIVVGKCDDCVPAKDPNAKIGIEGDLVPGQVLTYTITIENVGAGEAFDVFAIDRLGPHFDETTLTIRDGGSYIPSSRTLSWQVGTLAPKGQPGSTAEVSFSVRLRAGLPSGTVITNQAVVHFPSVPEETPTNVVVNAVQPLVARDQTVTTQTGRAVGLALSGLDVTGAPLSYAIVEGPLYGTLSGTAPNLTYTPMEGFVGVDQLRFTVSNGVSTSKPGEVTLQVAHDPAERVAPRVTWFAPGDGAQVAAEAEPRFADAVGELYAPLIRVKLSEPIDPATLTAANVRLSTGGRALVASITYDRAAGQILILAREKLLPQHTYTVTLSDGVRDLAGNALAGGHSWSFHTGTGEGYELFLPLLRR